MITALMFLLGLTAGSVSTLVAVSLCGAASRADALRARDEDWSWGTHRGPKRPAGPVARQ